MKIYLDLDGVFTDFERYYAAMNPAKVWLDETVVGHEAFWAVVLNTPDFWLNLPLMPGAPKLWAFVNSLNFNSTGQHVELEILSAPGKSDEKRAREQKPVWVRTNLSDTIKINLVYSKDKQQFASPTSILIDDYSQNCEQWRARGGVAIQHKSADETIAELKRMFSLS